MQVMLLDTSVKSIRTDLTYDAWWRACTPDDGGVIDSSW